MSGSSGVTPDATAATAGGRRRVLVLASTFPAGPDDPVPAFVRDQVVALAEAHPDLEFHVLAPHDRRSDTVDRSEHGSYTEHRFHYAWPRRFERLAGRGIMPALRESPILYAVVPALFLGEWRAARRLARELRPAVFYAHWFTPQAVVASWVARAARIPFVLTTHASDVAVWRKIPLIGPRIVRSVARRASAMTAVSSRTRAKLTAFLPESDAERVEIIPMGVPVGPVADIARRTAARERWGLGAAPTALFIGRLVEKKGVEYLLDALAAPGPAAGWRLLLAGDGPLRAALEARAAEIGLADRVTFLGFASGEDKADAFAAADAMVVPSVVSSDGDAEGLPVALLEGLAAGLPCIATRESGADDILTDGVDGYLCGERDSAALAAALAGVAALSPVDEAGLRARARALADSFAWPVIAARHADALFRPLGITGERAAR